MGKKNKRMVRMLALLLAILLVGGVVIGALVSAFAAHAETAPARNQCELTMEYLPEQQALHIQQRLFYLNRTSDALDRVVFYAAGNMFRRQDALMYESDQLARVFPEGYAPGGIDLREVTVDGESADYGFQGENEMALRVACDLKPGEQAAFEFDYYLLLTRCGAFIGVGDIDARLGAFCFVPGVYSAQYREFDTRKPLPFTRWLYADAMDYAVDLRLPAGYALASTGTATLTASDDAGEMWHIAAENARDFGLSFGRRYRVASAQTDSGVELRVFSGRRDAARVLRIVRQAVEQCEAWFGPLPVRQLDVAQSDMPSGTLNYPGLIQVSDELMDAGREDELRGQLRFCVAQQYFGLSAYVEPGADAWLSDSLCQYARYLMLEEAEGRDAFLKALNRDWVSALQLTIPGGLRVNSDAAMFDSREYDIVVNIRGAVVFHELREAMGRETLIEGLRAFYELGQDGHTLTEMELVQCLDEVSGRSWEDFLTDWVFNVGEYVNQSIDWLT